MVPAHVSVEIARSQGARVILCPRRGYGSAIRYGIESAESTYILFGDADGIDDLGSISGFVRELRNRQRLSDWNETTGRIEPGAMPFLHRYLGTPVLTEIPATFCSIWTYRIVIPACGDWAKMLSGEWDWPLPDGIRIGDADQSRYFRIWRWKKFRLRFIGISVIGNRIFTHGVMVGVTYVSCWFNAPMISSVYPGFFLFLLGTGLLFLQVGGPVTFGFLHMDLHFMILGISMSVLGMSAFQMGMIISFFPIRMIITEMIGWSGSWNSFLSIGRYSWVSGWPVLVSGYFWWFSYWLGTYFFGEPSNGTAASVGLYFVFIGISLCFSFFSRRSWIRMRSSPFQFFIPYLFFGGKHRNVSNLAKMEKEC